MAWGNLFARKIWLPSIVAVYLQCKKLVIVVGNLPKGSPASQGRYLVFEINSSCVATESFRRGTP